MMLKLNHHRKFQKSLDLSFYNTTIYPHGNLIIGDIVLIGGN
jgi:hypothetical protein